MVSATSPAVEATLRSPIAKPHITTTATNSVRHLIAIWHLPFRLTPNPLQGMAMFVRSHPVALHEASLGPDGVGPTHRHLGINARSLRLHNDAARRIHARDVQGR